MHSVSDLLNILSVMHVDLFLDQTFLARFRSGVWRLHNINDVFLWYIIFYKSLWGTLHITALKHQWPTCILQLSGAIWNPTPCFSNQGNAAHDQKVRFGLRPITNNNNSNSTRSCSDSSLCVMLVRGGSSCSTCS